MGFGVTSPPPQSNFLPALLERHKEPKADGAKMHPLDVHEGSGFSQKLL